MALRSRVSNAVESLRTADGSSGTLAGGVAGLRTLLVFALVACTLLVYVLFWLNVARLHVLDGSMVAAVATGGVAILPPVLVLARLR